MNDKVYVKIRGLSAQEAGDAYKEAEDIEIISVGRYTRRAGKEYIRYEEAKPFYEKARALKPDQKDLWLQGLYRVYYNLNMGPEFEEIDKMMK